MKFFTEAWRSGDDETPGPERWAAYQRHLEVIARRSHAAREVVQRFGEVNLHDAVLVEVVAVADDGVLRLELALPQSGWDWASITIRYEGVIDPKGLLEGLRRFARGRRLELLDDEWDLVQDDTKLVHRAVWWGDGEARELAVLCDRASSESCEPVHARPEASRFRSE